MSKFNIKKTADSITKGLGTAGEFAIDKAKCAVPGLKTENA